MKLDIPAGKIAATTANAGATSDTSASTQVGEESSGIAVVAVPPLWPSHQEWALISSGKDETETR